MSDKLKYMRESVKIEREVIKQMENKDCPCKKKKCERHGKCDECRLHHAESKCQRPVACEKTKKKSFSAIDSSLSG